MAKSGSIGRLKWFLIFLVLAAIGGGVWYFTRDSDSTPQFQTTTVTRGDIVQAVTAAGTLNPVLNVQVGSQISGIIQKLYVDYNSPVKANQVVAQLDPSTYEANVHSAEATWLTPRRGWNSTKRTHAAPMNC